MLARLTKIILVIGVPAAAVFCALRHYGYNAADWFSDAKTSQADRSSLDDDTPNNTSRTPSEREDGTDSDAYDGLPVIRIVPAGQEIPRELACGNEEKVLELTYGDANVYVMSSDGNSNLPQCYELTEGGGKLVLHRNDTEEVINISRDIEGEESELLVVVRTHDGRIRTIETPSGQPAAVQFPTDRRGGSMLLLPDYRINLPDTLKGLAVEGLPETLSDKAQVETQMLESTEYELRFGAREKAKDLCDALHGSARFALPQDIVLPDVADRSELQPEVVTDEEGTVRLHLPQSGRSGAGTVSYTPEIELNWDFREEVLRRIIETANTTHGGKKGSPAARKYSIAHLYYLLNTMKKTEAPDKKKKIAEQYFDLFRDAQFRAFCEQEMNYLPIPTEDSVSYERNRIVVHDGSLKQLMRLDVRSVSSYINDILTQAAQKAYTACREKTCAVPTGGYSLRLQQVETTPETANELIRWKFSLEKK